MGLERFEKAHAFAYEMALGEMKAGRKRSHWMWYIFPQIKGLGHSYNANLYGIAGLDEARDFVAHPILNAHLREITTEILNHKGVDARTLMGSGIDAKKLQSSMTLFDIVSPNDIYRQVLDVFFEGKKCRHTYRLLH